MNTACRSMVAGGVVAGALFLGACTDGGPTDEFVEGGPPVAATPAVTVEPSPSDAESTPGKTPADDAGESPGATTAGNEDPSETSEDQPVAGVTLGEDEEHRISSAGVVTLHCEGLADIKVEAAAVVTVTGTCGDIEVAATGAALTLESAGDLKIGGDSNTVTTASVDTVEIEGDSNVVDAGEIRGELDLSGNDNAITFASGSPAVDDDGSRNVIG